MHPQYRTPGIGGAYHKAAREYSLFCLRNLRQTRTAVKDRQHPRKQGSGKHHPPINRGKHRRCAYGGDGGLTHRFKRTDSRCLKPLLCKYLFHFITSLLSELHLFPDREYPRSRYCRPLSYSRLPKAANCCGAGALCSGLFCRYRSSS